MTADVVFLLDVDNTLLDGDRIVADFTIERIGERTDLDLSSLIKRPAYEARATLEMP